MNMGRIEGSVVCTVKQQALSGIKLLAVRQIKNGEDGSLVIAADYTRCAGIGDTVYMIGRKEASLLFGADNMVPSDLTIAGIIDPSCL